MKTKIFILLVLTASLSKAQNKNLDYKHAIKFYNLSSYQKTTSVWADSSNLYSSYYSYLQIIKPTVAYSWKGKNQNFNELELSALSLFKKVDNSEYNRLKDSQAFAHVYSGTNIISSSISLRYEYIINFFKNSDCKIAPSLGLAINPYFDLLKFKPHTTLYFPTTTTTIGTKGFIIPRLIYYYSSKVFFDMNIPLEIFEAKTNFYNVRNPALPVTSQRFSNSDFNLFPNQFSLRLGIGVKI